MMQKMTLQRSTNPENAGQTEAPVFLVRGVA
jgi:hypothetical protein